MAGFDSDMRQALLDCCALDWSRISPAIFGSLFQSHHGQEGTAQSRRALHQRKEHPQTHQARCFSTRSGPSSRRLKSNRNRLFEFHKKLRSLTFLDPACGCGNFLVIAYRELRLLELEVLRASRASAAAHARRCTASVQPRRGPVLRHRDRGIPRADRPSRPVADGPPDEPARVGGVRPVLRPHSLERQRQHRVRQRPAAGLERGVAGGGLELSCWGIRRLSAPNYMDDAQRADVAAVFAGINNAGAAGFCRRVVCQGGAIHDCKARAIRCAFVSTNSITQGEQVGALWGWLLAQGMQNSFRPPHLFVEQRGARQGRRALRHRRLRAERCRRRNHFRVRRHQGRAHAIQAGNINPYLVDAPDVVLINRSQTDCAMSPEIGIGNKPIDGGHYLFTRRGKSRFRDQGTASRAVFPPLDRRR